VGDQRKSPLPAVVGLEFSGVDSALFELVEERGVGLSSGDVGGGTKLAAQRSRSRVTSSGRR